MNAKVELIRKAYAPHGPLFKRRPALMLTQSLPFYRKNLGLVHRVRDGRVYQKDDDTYSHTSIGFWCGNTGFLGLDTHRKNGGYGALFAEPPEHAVHCATCEGRATGAGLNGARVICGRTVLYSPRI